MNLDSGYKCGKCGAAIPMTNIAVGRRTWLDKILRNEYPISHFWCDACDAITVIRKTVLERDWFEFHVGHLHMVDADKEHFKLAAKIWEDYLANELKEDL